MGQIGCFVPAKSAHFGCIDRIFTRVGAQDNLAAGESTFLVEMQEAANIMNNATQKSLILLDEVGRGTATFDGISIAWAITEYIHNSIGAKTLFATHYHELNELAGRYERIINYKVEVIESGSTVIFSHKVMPGASDHSFGIHVAKMAGLPQLLIERANEIMHSLEGTATDTDEKSKSKPDTSTIKTINPKSRSEQLAIFEFRDDELRNRLFNLNVNKLTPIEALQIISDWQKEAKKGW
ncbi:MAG: mutS1 [Ignavibacteria bacterium]|nr:mutS1 [Ignavibacteria bacterium]